MIPTAAFVALVGLATASTAQIETRNAIIYGARAVGETTWHFGPFAMDVPPKSQTATFEIGTFFVRAQGVGFLGADYTTYIDGAINDFATDTVQIVEDTSNGTPPAGVDGRVGVFNLLPQTQKVFANRGPGITGTGYRIATAAGGPTGAGDTEDTTNAGGISPVQQDPVGSAAFQTADRVLVYRFNLTVSKRPQFGSKIVYTVRTPPSRIGEFYTYNDLDSQAWTDFGPATGNLPTVAADSLQLSVNWVPKAIAVPVH